MKNCTGTVLQPKSGGMPGLRSPSHSFTREPASAGFLRCGCRKPVKGLHDLCQSVRPRGTGNVHAPRGQAPHETAFRMRLARLAIALLSMVPLHVFRTAERRVGEECVRTCIYREWRCN